MREHALKNGTPGTVKAIWTPPTFGCNLWQAKP